MIRDAHDRMTDPEELEAQQDEILFSTLDYFPGEPESSYGERRRARELLQEDALPLSDREIILVFRRFRWLVKEKDVA